MIAYIFQLINEDRKTYLQAKLEIYIMCSFYPSYTFFTTTQVNTCVLAAVGLKLQMMYISKLASLCSTVSK